MKKGAGRTTGRRLARSEGSVRQVIWLGLNSTKSRSSMSHGWRPNRTIRFSNLINFLVHFLSVVSGACDPKREANCEKGVMLSCSLAVEIAFPVVPLVRTVDSRSARL